MMTTIERESDEFPILLTDVNTSIDYETAYRKTRAQADRCTTKNIEAFLNEFKSYPVGKLIYYLFPGPEIKACKDVLKARRKKDSRGSY